MWNTITHLFSRKTEENGETKQLVSTMESQQQRPQRRLSAANLYSNSGQTEEAYDSRQAKQRASIKWLLSKAFNNRVPDNLREPFYRDHEGQYHLKPHIVQTLANAELYCLALGNIYADPNFHNLNHSGVVQALIRKGVNPDPPGSDSPLTETTLIQTSPLRLSAHLAIIDSLMALYVKEVATPDAVAAAVARLSHLHAVSGSTPEPAETLNLTSPQQALLTWLNCCSKAMNTRLRLEGAGDSQLIPEASNVQDLCDGVALAALVSLYCPSELPWETVALPSSSSSSSSVAQAVHNLSLVQSFCQSALPSDLLHLSPEDVTFLRSSMSQNMLAFLADMFNVLEIHPAKCVCFPGQPGSLSLKDLTKSASSMSQPAAGSASMVQMTSSSLRRTMSLHHTQVPDQQDDRDQFVVHRTKGVPTLLNSSRDETDDALMPARLRQAKEKFNQDSKAEERGEIPAAGKPSNWEVQRRSSTPQFAGSADRTVSSAGTGGSSSAAGRRSRRNSLSAEESQLTVENFGGSQENLHFIGRNPDKEPAVHVGRRSEVREKEDREKPTPNHELHRLTSLDTNNSSALQDALTISPAKPNSNNRSYNGDSDCENVRPPTSFAELSRQQQQQQQQQNSQSEPPKSSLMSQHRPGDKKTATFAALPNTTTWRQQQQQQQQPLHEAIPTQEEGQLMAAQLHNIRLKLEEKRRHIESDKRRTEIALSRQRQKVGKAAFLQAVTKEINDDVVAVENRWLSQESVPMPAAPPEDPRTPDLDNEDIETYHQSLAQMNSSLQDLQADIQRLAHRQQHIHQVLEQGPPHQPPQQQQGEFYLHSGSPHQPQYIPQQQQQQQPLPNYHNYPYSNAPNTFSPPQHVAANTYTPTPPPRRTWANPNPQPVNVQNNIDNNYSPNSWMDPGRHNIPKYSQPQHYAPPPQHPVQPPMHLHPQQPQQQNPPQHQQQGGFMLHPAAPTAPAGHTSPYSLHNGTSSASPQHRQTLSRLSQIMGQSPQAHPPQVDEPVVNSSPAPVHHAPIPAPPEDSMAPQSISFIEMTPNNMNASGDSNELSEELTINLQRLNITSGSRTYRLPSPTRPPPKARPAYQTRAEQEDDVGDESEDVAPTQNLREGVAADKGFYISFEEAPKRPKPPLRTRKMAQRKEQQMQQQHEEEEMVMASSPPSLHSRLSPQPQSMTITRPSRSSLSPPATHHYQQQQHHDSTEDEVVEDLVAAVAGEGSSGLGLVIGAELATPDPGALEEMEKKKEKILLASLRRRQQQEENKARKELVAAMAKEREQAREERMTMKREEDKARRAAILQQYKLKKAIEEAEREGKVLDKAEIQRLQSMCSTPSSPSPAHSAGSSAGPKMRSKAPGSQRPRPKTIHVDRSEGAGNGEATFRRQGSATNLAEPLASPSYGGTMRRAGGSYRGSQDNLTTPRRNSLYARESPDDGRGVSPSRSNQLGRRGSYRTSRETTRRSPSQPPSLQRTATNRRSSSLMNLSGSSTDQDSLAYPRYGDTDSGLGRATPPRRAPSPGMGGTRHLPSPSGPGSLPPGLMSKRRPFDDASSDISSSASSMMEYTGPRLYRQPATKSNRGIMLNAVEYCVFPGVVNREAKRRVLEEIARSESKHFLILFRDAGCQFRALYSYCPDPDREEVLKLYGTGPRQVTHNMLDKFFKYNSGGKCFSQVHTKHLTVTIDAFTIHNSLWQGKKVSLPNKRDMALVI